VTLSPDGTRLAAAVIDPRGGAAIEILSVPRLAQLKTVRAPAGKSLQFSHDGRMLVFGDNQGRVWLLGGAAPRTIDSASRTTSNGPRIRNSTAGPS
jgi:hypothetical protein